MLTPEPNLLAEGWEIHIGKGVYPASCLWCIGISQIHFEVKDEAALTPMGCMYIYASFVCVVFIQYAKMFYIPSSAWVSYVVRSTSKGNARASMYGTGNRYSTHAFSYTDI